MPIPPTAGARARLTISVELEVEGLRSRIATVLAGIPGVFLVAGWASQQLTACASAPDAVVVEPHQVQAARTRLGPSVRIFAVASNPDAAHRALTAGASAAFGLPIDAEAVGTALVRLERSMKRRRGAGTSARRGGG